MRNLKGSYARSILMVCCILTLGYLPSTCTHATEQINTLNDHALPLGDGKISHQPQRDYIFSCMTHFHGHGAEKNGDWIHGNTWDATQKTHVQGNVAWPDAQFTITTTEQERRIVGNGLPIQSTTGIFPVMPTDPAYQIDRNPNRVQQYPMTLSLPLFPHIASSASCVPMGMIGVTTGGVAIFNALDNAGRDAVAHEVQDHCNGHPERNGEYHYHGPSACMPEEKQNNALIGYALDGFGIFSNHDEHGKTLTNADLDECHGRTSPIMWNGKLTTLYHYVLTQEYPYTVGCFRGKPVHMAYRHFNDMPPQGRFDDLGHRPGHPPEEAIKACAGQSENSSCSFITPRGNRIDGRCLFPPEATLTCIPMPRS